jgi:hypothetical protein
MDTNFMRPLAATLTISDASHRSQENICQTIRIHTHQVAAQEVNVTKRPSADKTAL